MRRADWVYRGWETDEGGTPILDQMSYGVEARSIAASGSAIAMLYDSHDYMLQAVGGGAGAGVAGHLPYSARAEGRKATCLRVQGMLSYEASTWAAGSRLELGWRLGVFEQAADTGLVLLDVAYSMYTSSTLKDQPAVWANDQATHIAERRIRFEFSAGNEASLRTQKLDISFKRRLRSHECLALYLELPATSVGIRYQTWLRTLVQDEG